MSKERDELLKGTGLFEETWYLAVNNSHSMRGMWRRVYKDRADAELAIEIAKIQKRIKTADGDEGEVQPITVLTRGGNTALYRGAVIELSEPIGEETRKEVKRILKERALAKLSSAERDSLNES